MSKIKPASWAENITPSDSLPVSYRFIYVGVAGNLRVDLPNAPDQLFENLPVGFHPLEVTKVYLTNTTTLKMKGLR